MNTFQRIAVIVSIILGLFWGIYRIFYFDFVQPDEIGVWMKNAGNNGISDYTPHTGTFPIDFNPMTRAFKLPAQPWTIDCAPEKDAIWKTYYSAQKGEWTVDPQFTFSVDRNQAPLVCFRNNSMLMDNTKESKEKFLESVGRYLLMPLINDVFVEIIATNTDSTLMGNTYKYQRIVEDSVRIRFKRVGYTLETFVSNLNPPKSIIDKNRAKNEAEAAAITAKANVIKADAEAKVKVATANADAAAYLVTVRAEAEGTRLKQQSLTPLMIQSMWIDKWDGGLPHYVTGNNTGMMMQMPSSK